MRPIVSSASWMVTFAVLVAAPLAHADGEPDETFAGTGSVAISVGDAMDAARDMVLQPNGRIVVAGDSPGLPGRRDIVVARLRPNGALDETFGGGTGVVRTDIGAMATVGGVALEPTGQIVVVATTTSGDAHEVILARYKPNGDLDSTFNQVGLLTFDFGGISTADAVATQIDGKIVVVGSRSKEGELASRFGIARVKVDGTFDSAFDGDGKRVVAYNSDAFAKAVAIQDDGKILVAGMVATANGNDFALVRLNGDDGELDVTFNGNGKLNTDFGGNDSAEAVAVHPDGHIVAAGTRTNTSGSDFALAVYREEGELETGFAGNGKRTADFAANDSGRAVAVQNDGKIVVAGQRIGANGSDFAIARFNPDGSFDSTLDGDGKLRVDLFEGEETQDEAVTVAIAADGKLVLAGTTQMGAESDFAVARFLSTKSIPVGLLEIPGAGTTQSGIGLISGWLCSASSLVVRIDGVSEEPAYGTARNDTRSACGDTNNGFGLLFNWGLLGDGLHVVRALANGKQFASATFGVTTLGTSFLRGVTASYDVPGFPTAEQATSLEWAEGLQRFVIVGAEPTPTAATSSAVEAPAASLGVLENPAPGSFQSGVGVISGWICDASAVRIQIDDDSPVDAAYGTPRGDTQAVCGDSDNGYGLLINWGLLGDGSHTVQARADGALIGTATFNVTTFGTPFLRGAHAHYELPGFPGPGHSVEVDWSEAQQNFVITAYR